MINNSEKYYFKAFGLSIQSPIPIRGLIPIEPVATSDIIIRFEKIENYPELHITKVKRKGLIATFGMFKNDPNDAYMVWENQINFRLIGGNTMIVDSTVTDLDFLSLFIVSEPLGILLFQKGDILLHASAVKLPNGDGIVFMGEPGAGKSTTAAAFVKAGCNIISDDLVAIRLIDDKPYLIPSFPQIKLWKKSIEGLGYSYDKVERIVEGANKFAYYNDADFDFTPIILKKIFVLGAEKEDIVNEILTPIELLKHFALPEQLMEKGVGPKNHFEKTTQFSHLITIYEKPKMKNFSELKEFLQDLLYLTKAI